MRNLVVFLGLFGVMCIWGCKTSKNVATPKIDEQVMSEKNKLKREWVLKTIEGNEVGNKMLLTLNNKPYINLTENLKGFGGCNTIGGGELETKGDKISFEKIFSTRKACMGDAGKIETIFLDILNQTKHYKTEGHFLMLLDENGKKLATLIAIDWD